MQINNFIPKINYFSNLVNNRVAYENTGLKQDVFERSSNPSFKSHQSLKSSQSFKDILNKTYDAIPEREKNILRDEIHCIEKEVIDDVITSAKIIKKVYDEKYGENNWEYVSIGRSCEKIATALSLIGVKTYIIPISGLQNPPADIKEITEQDGFEKYKQYIYDMGLNPDTVEHSGKTYIFQDFCDKGTTMKEFEKIIRSSEINLDKQNIVFESINDALLDNVTNYKDWGVPRNYNPFAFIIQRLASQNTMNSLKSYSSISQLPYNHLGDVQKCKRADDFVSKIFDFGMEDKLKFSQ